MYPQQFPANNKEPSTKHIFQTWPRQSIHRKILWLVVISLDINSFEEQGECEFKKSRKVQFI